jgi:leucyl-tRNA synthetase
VEAVVLLLSPFAPHLAEEMWERLGHRDLVFREKWPTADPALLVDDSVEIPVQINGKVRDRVRVAPTAAPALVLETARALPRIQEALRGQQILKEIHVPGRMVSFVTRPANGRSE